MPKYGTAGVIKSIQRGSSQVGVNSPLDVVISTIDPLKSFLNISNGTQGANNAVTPGGRIKDANTIALVESWSSSANSSGSVFWEIVEYK